MIEDFDTAVPSSRLGDLLRQEAMIAEFTLGLKGSEDYIRYRKDIQALRKAADAGAVVASWNAVNAAERRAEELRNARAVTAAQRNVAIAVECLTEELLEFKAELLERQTRAQERLRRHLAGELEEPPEGTQPLSGPPRAQGPALAAAWGHRLHHEAATQGRRSAREL